MASTKKILVTGGTGFIGSSLVRALVKAGHTVRSLDNMSRGRNDRLSDIAGQFESIDGDIRDAEAVSKAIKGVDNVCHLAFINGTEFFYSIPDVILDVAVRGMLNVLDGCMKHGVGELVLASSSEVYQTPPKVPTDESAPLSVPDVLNPRYSYGGGKIISELMAINYGRKHFKNVTIFRPHNVYGPDMGWEHVLPQFILRMKETVKASPGAGPVDFAIRGDGTSTRSFIFIDDFTEGVMRVIEKGQHLNIYHIGTTDEKTVADVAREVGRFYGREVNIVPGKPVPGETARRCPDPRKLEALGWKPKTSFRDGLAITAKWYDANAHKAPAHSTGTQARSVS
jgi:nucleoside-diphosphate-sugar epimerase